MAGVLQGAGVLQELSSHIRQGIEVCPSFGLWISSRSLASSSPPRWGRKDLVEPNTVLFDLLPNTVKTWPALELPRAREQAAKWDFAS